MKRTAPWVSVIALSIVTVALAHAQSTPGAPAAPAPDQPVAKPGASTKQGAHAPGTADRLQLDPTLISGNRELPRVMFVVPWHKADRGDVGGPGRSLVDEALEPVDRDVFRRQNRFYAELSAPGAAAGKAPVAAPAQAP